MMARKPETAPVVQPAALSAGAPEAALQARLAGNPGLAEALYPAVEQAYQAARLKAAGAEPRLVAGVFVDDWKALDDHIDGVRAYRRAVAAMLDDWRVTSAQKAQAAIAGLRLVLAAKELFEGYTPILLPAPCRVPIAVTAHRLQGSGEHPWDTQQRLERETENAA